MLDCGEYYLVAVKTGTITFSDEGEPVVEESTYGSVLNFFTEGKAEEVIANVPKVQNMLPKTRYQLLIKAPEIAFDECGRVIAPKFEVIGCYRGTDLGKVAHFNKDVFELYDTIPPSLAAAVFKKEEPVCPVGIEAARA